MPKPAEIVLKKCLGLKKNEKVLIVTDSRLYGLSKQFFTEAEKITEKVDLIKIPIPKVNGTEPPHETADEMLKYDVELLITTMSLTHTKARKNACSSGARIVTMPDITESTIKRTLDIDYNRLVKRNGKLADIIDKGSKVRIKTCLGTDISFSIKGREAHGRDPGLYRKKGSFGNLPTGEVFVAPVEGTANGIFIADASFSGIGRLDKPLKVYVKGGYACNFEGYKAGKLEGLVDPLGKAARNIAEFGIGTNEKAIITGNILEDEKAIGTCHIALGNNFGFGGKTNVQLHLDGITKKPIIWVNEKKIMDYGKFMV